MALCLLPVWIKGWRRGRRRRLLRQLLLGRGRRPFYEANNSFWLSPLDRARLVVTFVNLCVSLLNFATWRTFRRRRRNAQCVRKIIGQVLRPFLRTLQITAKNQLNCRCGGLNISANTRPGQVNKNIVKSARRCRSRRRRRRRWRRCPGYSASLLHARLLCCLLHTRLNAEFMRRNLWKQKPEAIFLFALWDGERESETETVRVWARVCLLSGQRQCEALRPLSSHTHTDTYSQSYTRTRGYSYLCHAVCGQCAATSSSPSPVWLAEHAMRRDKQWQSIRATNVAHWLRFCFIVCAPVNCFLWLC